MTQRPWQPVLEHIRSLAAQGDSSMCDAELLRQFVSHRDESAFESLLRRHGPMVLRVARRSAGNDADADDVFQATFLLLARRAAAIRKRESVASWLYGVAHRLALSARSKRLRRQQREREAAAARPIATAPEQAWSEWEETLHEVLAQLPAKYRTPLVYCYLEGRTQEEVARQLGKPLGTVRSWLARGREMLRKRLLRRGISLSGEGASAALLASACATAEAVPPSLRIATIQAVHLFAAGGDAMTMLSPTVVDLVRKGMTAMLLAKLKSAAAWVLIASLLVAGSGWAAHRTFRAKPPETNENAEKAPPKQAAAEERPRIDAFGDPLPPGAVARLGTVRFRHEHWINQFAVSPDGHTLAAAADKTVVFWDLATGRPLRHFAFARRVHCLALTPNGKSMAVGGEDCIVRLIDSTSGKELRRFVGHRADRNALIGIGSGIRGVAFVSNGQILLSWGDDKTVRLWETHSGKALRQLGGEDWSVHGLSPDGKLLAATKKGSEKALRLWDVMADKEIHLMTQSAEISCVAFSPDGKMLAVASGAIGQPGRIALWELECSPLAPRVGPALAERVPHKVLSANSKELGTLLGHKDAVFALAFSPDGTAMASGGYDKTIRLWDLKSKKQLREAQNLRWSIRHLAFSRDGKTLLSSGSENNVRLWDVAAWRERRPTAEPLWGANHIAYSPDGTMLASATSNRIWLWATDTGKALRTLEGHEGTVSAVMFSLDEKSLISGSYDGTLCIWDVASGIQQRRISIGKGWVERVALSPDGKMLAVWGEATSRQIHLLNAATGAKLHSLDVPSEDPGVLTMLSSLCFSAGGKTLYASSGTHLSVLRWDAETGKALTLIGKHDGGLNQLALSSDERSLAVVTMDGTLYLWETATRQQRFVSKDAGYATAVAFSPDGRYLALANTGHHQLLRGNEVFPSGVENREQVRLVRVADGKVVRRFTGHLGGIVCLRFSPNGRTLASGGLDTTVLLWDVTDRAVPRAKEAPPLTAEKLAELWKGLRGTAAEAHGCMGTLIAAPVQTVPFLSEKLKPVVAVDAERFARLLKKLDSDQFAQREEATQELKKMGDAIEPPLRKAIQDKPTLETRRRLQALLDDLEGAERLHSLRAIEILERIGDKPARDLLRRLSEGAAGAWLTEEARMSLRRLQQLSEPEA